MSLLLEVTESLLLQLQALSNDIMKCQGQINATLDVLKMIRSDKNEYTPMCNNAVVQDKNLELDSAISCLAGRRKHQQNYPTSQPSKITFKECLRRSWTLRFLNLMNALLVISKLQQVCARWFLIENCSESFPSTKILFQIFTTQ